MAVTGTAPKGYRARPVEQRDELPVCDAAPQITMGFAQFRTQCALWRAVCGHEPGFPDHGPGAGDAQTGSFEIRPGLMRAVTANGPDVEPVALGEGLRNTGFDLRGKAGQDAKGRGDKRSDSDG